MEALQPALSVIKDLLLIGGIIYGLYEYFLFRKSKAKTEDQLFVDWFALGAHRYLLNVKLKISNKGQVRKYVKNMLLSIRTLNEGDIQQSIETKQMLRFSHKLKKKYKAKGIMNNILDEFTREREDLDFWVDANTSEFFRYPIAIDTEGQFIQVNIEYEMGRSGKKYLSEVLELGK